MKSVNMPLGQICFLKSGFSGDILYFVLRAEYASQLGHFMR